MADPIRDLLAEAGRQFRFYEQQHRAKQPATADTLTKAEVNRELAERIETALAAPAEAGDAAKVAELHGYLDEWMKLLGTGINGHQAEATMLVDHALKQLVEMRKARKPNADAIALILHEHAHVEEGRLENENYLAVKIAETFDPSPPRAELARLRAAPGAPEGEEDAFDHGEFLTLYRRAYGWTVDCQGHVSGLVAGDQGYESCSVPLGKLASWALGETSATPQCDIINDLISLLIRLCGQQVALAAAPAPGVDGG